MFLFEGFKPSKSLKPYLHTFFHSILSHKAMKLIPFLWLFYPLFDWSNCPVRDVYLTDLTYFEIRRLAKALGIDTSELVETFETAITQNPKVLALKKEAKKLRTYV